MRVWDMAIVLVMFDTVSVYIGDVATQANNAPLTFNFSEGEWLLKLAGATLSGCVGHCEYVVTLSGSPLVGLLWSTVHCDLKLN